MIATRSADPASKRNGHATYTLPVIDFAKAAWESAVGRRQNKPTLPATYHPNRTRRTIQAAYEDALYLAALWVAGLSISKQQATQQGLTVARWYYARALLDMARLIEGGQRQRLTTQDEATLRQRLESAFKRAQLQPELFYARIPPSMKRRNHRR